MTQVERVRTNARIGFYIGLATTGLGLLLAGGAALAAGDWWLARQPWIGLGLNLLVVGLALTAIVAVVRVIVEPVGWLRLLAVPPAAVAAVGWFFLLAVGPPLRGVPGAQAPRPDPATILYSLPDLLIIAIIVTLLIPLPLLVARLSQPRRPAPAPR